MISINEDSWADSTIPDPSHQTITTTLPEITPFIALQLRVAKLEQDMSEVKKTDHSAAILASIKSQVPTVVDKQADEDAMDKEVAVKVKDHKRKHDSDDEEDDDDDDEGPSAGSYQGRSAKRRRPESAASGSVQPPSKDDHQSSKKPRESDASASKQHPALTSTGWQITDIRDDVVNSLMHMLPNNIQILLPQLDSRSLTQEMMLLTL
ncbi:hypothetical protein Tco_0108576 [Tanacetum coccineum]